MTHPTRCGTDCFASAAPQGIVSNPLFYHIVGLLTYPLITRPVDRRGLSPIDWRYDEAEALFGGTDVSEVKRLRTLGRENAALKRLVGELTLANRMLEEVLGKNWYAWLLSARRRR